jgi:hypothetical protein
MVVGKLSRKGVGVAWKNGEWHVKAPRKQRSHFLKFDPVYTEYDTQIS